MVRYVDSSGWTWEVCELGAKPPQPSPTSRRDATTQLAPRHELADRTPLSVPAAAPTSGDGTLYFMSRLGTRKLRGYPRVWSSLTRQQLEALCDRAVAIGAETY